MLQSESKAPFVCLKPKSRISNCALWISVTLIDLGLLQGRVWPRGRYMGRIWKILNDNFFRRDCLACSLDFKLMFWILSWYIFIAYIHVGLHNFFVQVIMMQKWTLELLSELSICVYFSFIFYVFNKPVFIIIFACFILYASRS